MLRLMVVMVAVPLLGQAWPRTGHDYCDGWNTGYEVGACYQRSVGCVPPVPPLCPLPEMGADSYQDGYNRGFLAGLARGR